MNPLRLVFVEPKDGGKIQDGVTVTPTKEEQTVEPDPGFDGLGAVKVEAIPDAFQDVTGVNAGAEDIRVGKVGIDAQGNLLNGEMLPRKPEQEKSVVPTKQAQTVSPDSGHALSAVNVSKIPDAYQDVSFVDAKAADIRVGKTGVSAAGERLDGQMLPQKPEQIKSATPTTSPQSVTPDTGYALSRVDVGAIPSEYADVSDVTATAGTVLTGSDFVDASGTLVHGACDYDADTSDADATAGQIEAGATAYVGGAKVIGTMPIRSADVEISDLSPVPIPAGSYDGTVMAKLSSAAAAEVDAQYIAQGHDILGVRGQLDATDNLPTLIENNLTDAVYPNVLNISKYSFCEKTLLKNAVFANCTEIGAKAFYNCTALLNAFFESAVRVNESAFEGCSNLSAINFQSLISIGKYGFMSCSNLISCSFPNALSTGVESFENCTSLERVNFQSATSISNFSFYNCTSLNDIGNLDRIAINIGQSPFYNTLLTDLVFDSLVTAIGEPRYHCFDMPQLTKIEFGTNIQSLSYAFKNAPNLKTIIIRANSVPTLVQTQFENTPFAANGSGGTLYCPQNLISQYEQATNWSVILAYPNNQILPIEGSPYEVTT